MNPTWIEAQEYFYFNNGDISNRVCRYGDCGPLLLFVPGWASTEYTWRKFLPYLSLRYRVHYFESREKSSANRSTEDYDLSVAAMARDLAVYADSLDEEYFLAGASLGASMIIECLPYINANPKSIVLICPNLSAKLPSFFPLICLLPASVVRIIRPFVLWMISTFSYRADGERIAGMIRAMGSRDVDVLRQSAVQLAKWQLSPARASTIDVPILTIGTLQDEIHNLEHAIAVAKACRQGKMKTLPTFADAHSSRCASLVDQWFSQLR